MFSVAVLIALTIAACGNDDNAAVPPPTAAPAATPETSTDDSEEMAMDDAQDDHSHDHATLMEVDYEPVPTIELRTHLDPKSGVNLEVITTGFTLAPERASTEPVAGEGHFHIYVDGVKLRRLYAHWAHVDLQEPGDYEIRVEMSANDHAALAVNGVKLDATTIVTIPGPSEGVDAVSDMTIKVDVVGGKPVDGVQRFQIDARDTVTIIVSGDTTDELHIHGYDLVVGFAPGQPGSITFEADIPGIFEAETHHNGDLVMELEVR